MAKLVELDADPQAVRAGIQAAGITSFGSLENLVNAYSTLYRYLKDNYDDISKLKKYWGYPGQQCGVHPDLHRRQ
jgi:hypothetical protein